MLPYLFVLLAIAVRFLPFAGPLNFMPHAWHFTPLAASLLFFGARGQRRRLWIPLVMLAATDVILTKYIYSLTFSWDQLVTWAWYAAILWLGTNLRERTTFWRVGGVARNVSPWFQRIDDVVLGRNPVLPRDCGKRFVFLSRIFLRARVRAHAFRAIRKLRGPYRRGLIRIHWSRCSDVACYVAFGVLFFLRNSQMSSPPSTRIAATQ